MTSICYSIKTISAVVQERSRSGLFSFLTLQNHQFYNYKCWMKLVPGP
uniref:Uncharacterized protein n=1 Tax=Arundo donax TaxID=35708 RepID=A0A0A9G1X7_ARUDO